MGDDPETSVVNGWCQAHDAENLLIVGSAVFPTMAGCAARPTIAALAYRTSGYLKRSRELFASENGPRGPLFG